MENELEFNEFKLCRAYRCSACGAGYSKMWRFFSPIHTELDIFCLECRSKQQRSWFGVWMAAVPKPSSDSFYSWYFIPAEGKRWWESLPNQPITVDQVVEKLAELSERGQKSVCLTRSENGSLFRSLFCHDHSNEIGKMARTKYPFFGQSGMIANGSRGYHYTTQELCDLGELFPGEEDCNNFPLALL